VAEVEYEVGFEGSGTTMDDDEDEDEVDDCGEDVDGDGDSIVAFKMSDLSDSSPNSCRTSSDMGCIVPPANITALACSHTFIR